MNQTPSTDGNVFPTRAELEARLQEAEETLAAIRNGDVDAVVVGGAAGQQVYTLENADRPYRVLIEQMREGAVTLSEEGTILYCNQRFATIVGATHEMLIGTQFERFLCGSERASFHVLLAMEPFVGMSREYSLQTGDDADVPVNMSLVDLRVEEGALRVVCGVVTDLTANRQRSNELTAANLKLATEIDERRRAEASLQIALDAAGMGSWDLDLISRKARRSLRHDQIFGHAQLLPEWQLQTAVDHFLPDDRPAVERAFTDAVALGSLEFEKRIKRPSDGATRMLHVKGQTFYEDRTAVRIAGIVADVTDRHEIEEQLRQAQKMEAVGQLTGGLAHDFNNLLTGITGSLDLLAIRVTQGRLDDLDRYLSAAQDAAKRAASLTHRLLAFSRRQTLDPRPTDVNQLVTEMEDLIRRTVGPAIALHVMRREDLWNSLVDPPQLESALLNLSINARDAMPDGGLLTIETGNIWLDTAAAAERELKPGAYITLSVVDTGTGMPPDVIERAFDPFYTTKPIGQGTGLGLSMIYGFTRQSGGQVRIQSEMGRGTTMCLYLPRYMGHLQAADAPSEKVGSPTTLQGETVLVVDDEPTVRMLMTEVLEDLGYIAIEEANGANGLKVLQSGVHIDLLVTDVGLPGGMNGRQLADAARVTRPDLKILFVTGYAETAVLSDGHLDPGMHVMTKPFAMDALAGRVKELLTK